MALGGPALLLPALLPPQQKGTAAPCLIAAAGGGVAGADFQPPALLLGWEGEGQCKDLPLAGPFPAAVSDKLALGVVL